MFFILPAHMNPSTITIGAKKNGVFKKKYKYIFNNYSLSPNGL